MSDGFDPRLASKIEILSHVNIPLAISLYRTPNTIHVREFEVTVSLA